MKTGCLTTILLAVVASVSGCAENAPPPSPAKPSIVPDTAASAIGADGGAWIDCVAVESPRVRCDTYFAPSGRPWTTGTYVPVINDDRVDDISAADLASLLQRFSLYDGIAAHFGTGERLVPDGDIDAPVGTDLIKRTTYSMGKVVIDERPLDVDDPD